MRSINIKVEAPADATAFVDKSGRSYYHAKVIIWTGNVDAGDCMVYLEGEGGRPSPWFSTDLKTMDRLAVEWCKARGIIPGLTDEQVQQAQKATERWMEAGEAMDAPGLRGCDRDEIFWNRKEDEADLAEMFMNILPKRKE
jgi:hypothetical protein